MGANIEGITTALEKGNGCDLGLAMADLKNTEERFDLLQRIAEMDAARHKDNPNLPELAIVVSNSRDGSAGALVTLNGGEIWEADWDSTGKMKRNVCVKD